MTVRLINTTTFLPADKTLEEELLSVMKPELKGALLHLYVPFWPEDAPIDVFLVNKLDIKSAKTDHHRTRDDDHDGPDDDHNTSDDDYHTPDTEALGVYYPHHTEFCRPTIEVCPEEIMKAAKGLLDKVLENAPEKVPLTKAYPALFCKVVIHEFGHALMDNNRTRSREYEPWHFLASRFDEPDREYFEHVFPPGGRADDKCKDRSYLKKLDLTVRRTMPHFIEESLANAIALNQNYGVAERFIRGFVERQPAQYKAALRWELNLPELLATASNWSAWKDTLFDASKDYRYNPNTCSSKQCLIHRLLGKGNAVQKAILSKESFEAKIKGHASPKQAPAQK